MAQTELSVLPKARDHIDYPAVLTAGDLIYWNGSDFIVLSQGGVGNAGKALINDGDGTFSWGDASGGGSVTWYTETVGNGQANDWTLSAGRYYITINHDLGTDNLLCSFRDTSTGEYQTPEEIEEVDNNNLKIWVSGEGSDDVVLYVSIAGNNGVGGGSSVINKSIKIENLEADDSNPPSSGRNAIDLLYSDFSISDKVRFTFQVPTNYIVGDDFSIKIMHSTSSDASYERQWRVTTRLLQPNTDAATGGNTETFDSGDITGHATSHMLQDDDWAISNSGEINSNAIAIGDYIQCTLERIAIDDGSEASDVYLYDVEVRY